MSPTAVAIAAGRSEAVAGRKLHPRNPGLTILAAIDEMGIYDVAAPVCVARLC
jgi:hypothetical protein